MPDFAPVPVVFAVSVTGAVAIGLLFPGRLFLLPARLLLPADRLPMVSAAENGESAADGAQDGTLVNVGDGVLTSAGPSATGATRRR